MTRYIAIIVGTTASIDPERLRSDPSVEVYHVNDPNAEHYIDMALLNDLVCPVKLVFIGGEEARRYAGMYHGTWIEDGPEAEEQLRRVRELPPI